VSGIQPQLWVDRPAEAIAFCEAAAVNGQTGRRCRTRPRQGLSYARLGAPISSTRNTGWSLGSGSLVKHGFMVRPQTFR
jgi:hypothetical protein